MSKSDSGAGGKFHGGFSLLVVLFILLIIIGTAYTPGHTAGYGGYC